MSSSRERANRTDTVAGASSLRLFFALHPDSNACHSLAALAADVARATGGRAPRTENLHVTVAFLGDVQQERVANVEAIGALSAAAAEPFVLTLERIGLFRNAGIAWAAPDEIPAALLRIVETLREALQAAGLRVERRAFRPHVTLARRCAGPLSGAEMPRIAWRVDALALMASETLPEGPRYRELKCWSLPKGRERSAPLRQ
jgi:RNA 2',3'-cyclic 3'-phosphodiesterase